MILPVAQDQVCTCKSILRTVQDQVWARSSLLLQLLQIDLASGLVLILPALVDCSYSARRTDQTDRPDGQTADRRPVDQRLVDQRPQTTDQIGLSKLATHALRAYAVGAAFSVRDVADELRWRPTDAQWTDVYYGPARPQPTSDNRPRNRARRASSPVRRTVDPSRIRTPEQRRAAARRVANAPW